MTMLKTRFAPSPTGNLHLGGARTALIYYIISKKSVSSKFYLRIEDTDHERSKQEYTDNITNSLKWLELDWDEDIQVQSKRLSRHQEIAKELLQKKRAFKCVCSEEKIASQRKLIRENKENFMFLSLSIFILLNVFKNDSLNYFSSFLLYYFLLFIFHRRSFSSEKI